MERLRACLPLDVATLCRQRALRYNDLVEAVTPPDTDIRIIYVPCGSEVEAHSLAATLVERRLVACANIYTSRSIYRWDGELADETEHVVFAKTTAARAPEAAATAEQLHSYDTPCVLVIEAAGANARYGAWVRGEVGPAVAGETTD
jgi:periplasmic divalent cation tolerance protein